MTLRKPSEFFKKEVVSVSDSLDKIATQPELSTFSYAPFTSTPDLNVEFRIGAEQFGVFEPWCGNISQILVYNRSLSDSEITQNYNAVRGRYGL